MAKNGFTIYNKAKLIASMRKLSSTGRTSAKLQVGYAAPYAIYVHEDMTKQHPTGQAKFLEEPIRTYKDEIDDEIVKYLKQKKSLEYALTKAGEWILNMSRLYVPVDTGVLRDSGFVKVEK